jgi:hypothetical protein
MSRSRKPIEKDEAGGVAAVVILAQFVAQLLDEHDARRRQTEA